VVTHTFVKVRQEPKQSDPSNPYVSSIAYREMAHCQGEWRWAFDLAAMTTQGVEWVVRCLAHVNYVGKRGSFIQFRSVTRTAEMSEEFTQAANAPSLLLPGRSHIAPLDDFGPEASMEILNSFAKTSPKLERHRKFVPTIVPLGLVNTGPGFSEYHR
jgi:hypothetical protein